MDNHIIKILNANPKLGLKLISGMQLSEREYYEKCIRYCHEYIYNIFGRSVCINGYDNILHAIIGYIHSESDIFITNTKIIKYINLFKDIQNIHLRLYEMSDYFNAYDIDLTCKFVKDVNVINIINPQKPFRINLSGFNINHLSISDISHLSIIPPIHIKLLTLKVNRNTDEYVIMNFLRQFNSKSVKEIKIIGQDSGTYNDITKFYKNFITI